MRLTEFYLSNMTATSGWVAERAQLSPHQIVELWASIKHPVTDERMELYSWWFSHLFGASVDRLRVRSTASGWRTGMKNRYRPKLTTVARRELGRISSAIEHAQAALSALSNDEKQRIEHNSPMYSEGELPPWQPAGTFRHSWHSAHERLLWLQFACRLVPNGVVSKATRWRLKSLGDRLDAVVGAIDEASDLACDVLELVSDELEQDSTGPSSHSPAVANPCRDANRWLGWLKSVIDHAEIEVRPARDEVTLRQTITGLAEIYAQATDHEPGRVYRSIETARGDAIGETGDFLELSRRFVGFAYEASGVATPYRAPSLARVVREVLEERRRNTTVSG